MADLILIVDDEEDIRETVSTLLELNGFNTIESSNSEEMYDQLDKNDVSLILLDIGLPGNDGLMIMKELRTSSDLPVVMLTGKGDVIDKVVGLELGADDYITKPFHAHELIARLKSILRRSTVKNKKDLKNDQNSNLVSFNGWKLDIDAQKLINPDDEEIMITGHEFAILHTLINSSGNVVTRDQLLDHVNAEGREHLPPDRSLDVMISKLRKKFGDSPTMPEFIRTIRKSGYMFMAKIK